MLLDKLAGQAAAAFGGQVVLAHDLDRIPVPPRRQPAAQPMPTIALMGGYAMVLVD